MENNFSTPSNSSSTDKSIRSGEFDSSTLSNRSPAEHATLFAAPASTPPNQPSQSSVEVDIIPAEKPKLPIVILVVAPLLLALLGELFSHCLKSMPFVSPWVCVTKTNLMMDQISQKIQGNKFTARTKFPVQFRRNLWSHRHKTEVEWMFLQSCRQRSQPKLNRARCPIGKRLSGNLFE